MNCNNWHSTPRDPRCPYCVLRVLYQALERVNPDAPELTPAAHILVTAEEEIRKARKAAL